MFAMIDLVLYAVVVPLVFLVLISGIVGEVQEYSRAVEQQQLMVQANSLADLIVNSPGGKRIGLAKQEKITESITKTFPLELENRTITEDQLGLSDSTGTIIKLRINGVEHELISKPPFEGDAYTVNRWVLWEGEPAELMVTLFD